MDAGNRGRIDRRITNPEDTVAGESMTERTLESGGIEVVPRVTADVQRVAEFVPEIRVGIEDPVATSRQGQEGVNIDVLPLIACTENDDGTRRQLLQGQLRKRLAADSVTTGHLTTEQAVEDVAAEGLTVFVGKGGIPHEAARHLIL
jgi:hypothetical protein